MNRPLRSIARHVTKSKRIATERFLCVSSKIFDTSNVEASRRSSKLFERNVRPFSFISKAKAMGANALLGAFITNSGRFDESLKDLKVQKMDKGEVECTSSVRDSITCTYQTFEHKNTILHLENRYVANRQTVGKCVQHPTRRCHLYNCRCGRHNGYFESRRNQARCVCGS